MKQTINKDQFRHAFQNMGRGEQFSYEALGLLFDHLTDYESHSDEELELDVIALCCDYVEMTEQELKDNYPAHSDYEEIEQFLTDHTWFCGKTEQNTFLFQQF